MSEFQVLEATLDRLQDKLEHPFTVKKAPGQYECAYFITFSVGAPVQDGNWGELKLGVKFDSRRQDDDDYVLQQIKDTFVHVMGSIEKKIPMNPRLDGEI